jgi:hypothetical protein
MATDLGDDGSEHVLDHHNQILEDCHRAVGVFCGVVLYFRTR